MTIYKCSVCKELAGTTPDCHRCGEFLAEHGPQTIVEIPRAERPPSSALVRHSEAAQAVSLADRETLGGEGGVCKVCGAECAVQGVCVACVDKSNAHLHGDAKGIAKAAKLGWAFLTRE